MKSIDSPPSSPIATQVLKLVGILLILSFIVDFLVLLGAAQAEPQWQLNMMNQAVDRGVIPLIGFALIYTGFWIESRSTTVAIAINRAPWQDSRFWAFVFASLLGLLFILLIPFHFSTVGQLTQAGAENINQQAAQAEIQLEQQQKQLQAIVDSGQLEQVLKSNQVPPDLLPLLQEAQKDPQAIEKRAAKRRGEIQQGQTQAVKQAEKEAQTVRLRVELRSLLLAIGFVSIGWNGLRDSR